jgi:sterol desaturase/sphingolipid hydroxylase (fatty acid hydroxylase superfamily)
VNFGTKFAFWDWLFGTAHLPPVKPRGYGILEPFPRGYLRQQLYLFQRRPPA